MFSEAPSMASYPTDQDEASLEIFKPNSKGNREEVTPLCQPDDKAVLSRLKLLSPEDADLSSGPALKAN